MKGKTMKRQFCLPVMTSSIMLLTAACNPPSDRDDMYEQQRIGKLTHVLDMVDREGRAYGRVELDPVGGGRVYDTDGRIIGHIVPPDRYERL
jgi:hypothetical protein